MKRGIMSLMIVASALALSGSALAATVSADTAPGVNFSAYRTYTWINETPPQGMNPVMYQRIIADFDQAFAARGFQKAGAADLTMIITIGAREKTDIDTWGGGGWGRWGGGWGQQTTVHQYTEGQLSIDVFDTSSKKALWHGQVTKTIGRKPDPVGVDKAITKLMTKFPATAAAAPPAQ